MHLCQTAENIPAHNPTHVPHIIKSPDKTSAKSLLTPQKHFVDTCEANERLQARKMGDLELELFVFRRI